MRVSLVLLGSWRPVPAPDPDPRARSIAVFDSGVGGLTVLHELLVSLPHEDFLYLGDTARFPYGERDPAQLRSFAQQIGELLLQRGAKLLVVACNSATAAALASLRERVAELAPQIEVIGVVEPESRLATQATHNGRVGLLATPATVASGAYERAVHGCDADVSLTSVACPDLAPIIQSGLLFDRAVVDVVRGYCQPLRDADVDTVILGCTHYPLVAPLLQRTLGRGVQLISSARAIAHSVEQALARGGLESDRTGEGEYRFLATGDVESFRTLGTRFLQMPIEQIEHVELPLEVVA
jgi:glutamate racemase